MMEKKTSEGFIKREKRKREKRKMWGEREHNDKLHLSLSPSLSPPPPLSLSRASWRRVGSTQRSLFPASLFYGGPRGTSRAAWRPVASGSMPASHHLFRVSLSLSLLSSDTTELCVLRLPPCFTAARPSGLSGCTSVLCVKCFSLVLVECTAGH